MNITFLIGNGFDLRLGMNTRYTDMYPDYFSKHASDMVIRDFKSVLQQAAPNGYKTWGDFEMSMAQHAVHFKSESELIACVRDFKEHMGSHLTKEENAFLEYSKERTGHVACAKELEHSLRSFHKGQTPNVINAIEALGDIEIAKVKFITFNYTSILDQIITYHASYYKNMDIEKPIHVHGSLNTDVVLGIDNVGQFSKLPYILSRRGERAFVKPLFNSQFDLARVKSAEQAIAESNVICVYGMSFGHSDNMWVQKVYDWLIADPNHHLIYFKYLNQQFSAWRRDEMMDEEDTHREELLNRFGGSERLEGIEDQVHIPIGYDIFDFRNAIDRDAEDRRRRQFSTPGSMKSY